MRRPAHRAALQAALVPALAIVLTLVTAIPAVAQLQDYSEVVPPSADTQSGLFTVHRVDDRLLFEIPDDVLGRDMIIMSRFAKAQQGLSNAGANMAGNITVRWERHGDRILVRAVSYQSVAEEDSAVALAVQNSSFPPILHSLAIQARGEGTSVIDVTDLYLGTPRPSRCRATGDRSFPCAVTIATGAGWSGRVPSRSTSRCVWCRPTPPTSRPRARAAGRSRSRSITRW